MSRSKVTSEQRIEAALSYLNGEGNYKSIADRYGVEQTRIKVWVRQYTWVKKFSQLGEAGLEDRRGKRIQKQEARSEIEELKIKMAKLEHELYMTKMERDLLKKLEELERGDAYRK